ncbi:hypothetical protein [Salipiger marinus]|uniref:hypothetical protein n=1 Tax=Salipiger marinus TaxID=555512 RepID=UPI00104237F8|nr:hypothetical protein [Salipiger marinus]
MTLVVGAIFAGFCFLVITALVTLIALNLGEDDTRPGAVGNAILVGFCFLFATVAYWSGSWLFFTEEEIASPRQETAEDYLGKWRSDAPSNITRTLISNNVRGCGEFHHKPSARNSGEYLVYCTPDGRNWAAYLVWPNVDRISGPAHPNPNIKLPR